jgi:hypothetical protein
MPQIYVFYQDNTDGKNNDSETGYDNAFHYQDWSGSGSYEPEYTSPTWSRTGYHTYWYLDRAEVYSYYYKGPPQNRNGWWYMKTVPRNQPGETLPNGTYPSGGKIKYYTWNAEQWNYFMVKSSVGITFYIEFSWHGGSERQNGKTFGNTYQLLAVKTAPAGYTHTGWYNDLMGHKSLSANVEFNFYAGDVAISATYTANTYKLAYNNTGTSTGGTAAGNVSYKGDYTLPTASPPTGYTFSSWSSTQGTTTTNGDNYTWNTVGDLTWTANYTANTYTINYDKNGGTGTTTATSSSYPTKTPTVAANGFTAPSGKIFMRWSTSATANSGTTYTAGNTYTFTSNDTSSVILYAKWGVTVTYNINNEGTVITVSTPTSFTEEPGLTVTVPTLKAVGYAFGGWATSTALATAKTVANAGGSTYTLGAANAILYAIWTENTGQKVSFSELQTVFGGSHPISMSEYRTQSGQTTAGSIITLGTHLKGKGPAP